MCMRQRCKKRPNLYWLTTRFRDLQLSGLSWDVLFKTSLSGENKCIIWLHWWLVDSNESDPATNFIFHSYPTIPRASECCYIYNKRALSCFCCRLANELCALNTAPKLKYQKWKFTFFTLSEQPSKDKHYCNMLSWGYFLSAEVFFFVFAIVFSLHQTAGNISNKLLGFLLTNVFQVLSFSAKLGRIRVRKTSRWEANHILLHIYSQSEAVLMKYNHC